MFRRFRVREYVIFGLVVLGLLRQLAVNPLPLLLIAAVVGGLIYFERRLSARRHRPVSRYSVPAKTKRKPSPFRVIPGTKGLSNEEPPKYH